jgi:hypothetical protein
MHTEQTQPQETFEVIERSGYKIIVSSKILEHISYHTEIGYGSVFKKGLEININLLPDDVKPGVNTVFFPEAIGYNLLMKRLDALNLPFSGVTYSEKESYAGGKRSLVKVPAIRTTLKLEEFATNEMSVLLFGYNPAFASNELKKFVEDNNAQDHLVWGSAFPGPMDIDGVEIKPVHMWKEGGEYDFAVIIPVDPGDVF